MLWCTACMLRWSIYVGFISYDGCVCLRFYFVLCCLCVRHGITSTCMHTKLCSRSDGTLACVLAHWYVCLCTNPDNIAMCVCVQVLIILVCVFNIAVCVCVQTIIASWYQPHEHACLCDQFPRNTANTVIIIMIMLIIITTLTYIRECIRTTHDILIPHRLNQPKLIERGFSSRKYLTPEGSDFLVNLLSILTTTVLTLFYANKSIQVRPAFQISFPVITRFVFIKKKLAHTASNNDFLWKTK